MSLNNWHIMEFYGQIITNTTQNSYHEG